jgi:aspartyl/asparaginyl-tRNA synthetase
MVIGHNYKEIDYGLLDKAKQFYLLNGFRWTEVPWFIPKEFTKTTFSKGTVFNTPTGDLLGSAEQSFIYLAYNNWIMEGKWCSITPCFREDEEDQWHQKYFIKLELFEWQGGDLEDMIDLAQTFFTQMIGGVVDRLETEEGYDLEYKGVELGSYGRRSYEGIEWVYGTGLAEPRFSTARRLVNC